MNVLTQNIQNVPGSVSTYILALDALAPKEALASQTQTEQASTPPVPLPDGMWSTFTAIGPYFLFFALFISAFGIQLMRKMHDLRTTMTALVISLLLAATPMVINRLNEQGTQQLTKAGPDEVPRSVKIEQINSSTLTISWTTDAEKSGSVRFGPAPLTPATSQVYVANSGVVGMHHTTVINNIKPNRVYELEILSGSTWYNFSGKPLRIPIQQKTR